MSNWQPVFPCTLLREGEHMDKILCSKHEAAEILGVSVRTIENLISKKMLTSRRIGRRRMVPYAACVQLARRDTPNITGHTENGSIS
jgi:excisionase family DNA binding protein